MIGLVDESTPRTADGAICYCVAAGVIPLGPVEIEQARVLLRSVIPRNRKRRFHWYAEGPRAQARMAEALEQLGVVGHAVVVPCGPRSQEAARAVALAAIIHQLVREGCDLVLIEKRTPAQDGRDKAVILDALRSYPLLPMDYDWRDKAEELLWMADAIGGAVHDQLTGDDNPWAKHLAEVTDLVIDWKCLPANEHARKRRQSRLPS